MRRYIRLLGTLLAVAGVLLLLWSLLVWQWQDPFTALYTKWKQRQLATQYVKRTESFKPAIAKNTVAAERASIAREAKRYRLSSTRGEVIGRLRVPRMGVNMLMVNGTDHDTLKKGPGRDSRTFMPGENRPGTAPRISHRSRTSTDCGEATASRSRFRTGRSSTP